MLSLSEDKLSDTVDLICSLTKVERESKTLKDSSHRLQSNEKHLYLVYDNKTHFELHNGGHSSHLWIHYFLQVNALVFICSEPEQLSADMKEVS